MKSKMHLNVPCVAIDKVTMSRQLSNTIYSSSPSVYSLLDVVVFSTENRYMTLALIWFSCSMLLKNKNKQVHTLHSCHHQELQHTQQRSTAQVTELQSLAEQQFKRANALSKELDKYKRELVDTKKQVR